MIDKRNNDNWYQFESVAFGGSHIVAQVSYVGHFPHESEVFTDKESAQRFIIGAMHLIPQGYGIRELLLSNVCVVVRPQGNLCGELWECDCTNLSCHIAEPRLIVTPEAKYVDMVGGGSHRKNSKLRYAIDQGVLRVNGSPSPYLPNVKAKNFFGSKKLVISVHQDDIQKARDLGCTVKRTRK
jgi:hypothetical protein